MCEQVAVEGNMPVILAAWTPNIAFLALGIVLLVRARRAGM
jgi:lipopolysaccharide export LptBFGC system permease protein LptF